MTVTIDVEAVLHGVNAREGRFLRVKDLARRLGVSNKTAGKILAVLERRGAVAKWSNGVYLVLRTGG